MEGGDFAFIESSASDCSAHTQDDCGVPGIRLRAGHCDNCIKKQTSFHTHWSIQSLISESWFICDMLRFIKSDVTQASH